MSGDILAHEIEDKKKKRHEVERSIWPKICDKMNKNKLQKS